MRRLLVVLCLLGAAVVGTPSPAHAAAPANDDIFDATVIPSLPFSDAVDTSEATYAPTDSVCGVATVWYRFTPTESGRIEISTAGSDYSFPTIELLTGDPSAPVTLQCEWFDRPTLTSDVTAGTTYFISVGTCCGGPEAEPGSVGPGGNLVLNVRVAPPLISTITLEVDRGGTVTPSGVVTFTGSIVCDQPAGVFITVEVTQRRGQTVATGTGYAFSICGPAPSSWTGNLTGYPGPMFGPGNAAFTAGGLVYDGPFVFDTDEGSMHLRRIQE